MDLTQSISACLLLVFATYCSARQLPSAEEGQTDVGHDTFDMERALESLLPKVLRSFEPNHTKCCKIGEKVARKAMTCSTEKHLDLNTLTWEEHAKQLLGSDVEHYLAEHNVELMIKSQICLLYDKYFGNFKKCCHYRLNHRTALRECRKFKSKSERRACRKDVHWQYP